MSSSDAIVPLQDRLLQNLGVGKVFRECNEKVNSLDFTPDGKFMIVSSDDNSAHIYDCEKAEKYKSLHCEKYGIDNIQFVHSGSASAICSSRNETDQSLRYWDLYENKFVRFFNGHTGPVTSLDVHPYEDLFISSSTTDSTALLWDLRKEKALARIGTRGTSTCSFDNQGLIFAVVSGQQKVHLFDIRQYEKGEFVHFDVAPFSSGDIRSVSFSPCGKFILLSTDLGEVFSIDSFKGKLVAYYRGAEALNGGRYEERGHPVPCFSPDSQFVACGTPKGAVQMWKTIAPVLAGRTDAAMITRLEGHTGFARHVKFNPVRCMVATACINTALWIPKQ
jgi:COMPASS component SWD2